MPRSKKSTSDRNWGVLSYLEQQTKPSEVKDRRQFNGFVMCWERDKAPSFERLKQLTEEYVSKNSESFQYWGSDVIKKDFQAFEAICTGYKGYYFNYGFTDVETRIILARYDNQNGIFIKLFEQWRIKSELPLCF